VITIQNERLRPVLAKQIEWFLKAIAVEAWHWHKPFSWLADPETAAAKSQEECQILINALIYGVMTPAFVEPVEIDFYPIFDTFFADPKINEKDSVHLAELLARALGEALES
jgi:hypothetical protein